MDSEIINHFESKVRLIKSSLSNLFKHRNRYLEQRSRKRAIAEMIAEVRQYERWIKHLSKD